VGATVWAEAKVKRAAESAVRKLTPEQMAASARTRLASSSRVWRRPSMLGAKRAPSARMSCGENLTATGASQLTPRCGVH